MMNYKLIGIFLSISMFGLVYGEELLNRKFDTTDSLKGREWGSCGKIVQGQAGSFMVIKTPSNYSGKGFYGSSYKFDPKLIAGKTLLITVEVKRDIPNPSKWQGGKVQFNYQANGKWNWPGIYMKPGKFDWEKKQLKVTIPQNVEKAILGLGIQNGSGTIAFRNLKVETI